VLRVDWLVLDSVWVAPLNVKTMGKFESDIRIYPKEVFNEIFFSGMGLKSPGTAVTSGLLYSPK
jgi:hypothetical protein